VPEGLGLRLARARVAILGYFFVLGVATATC